MVWVQWEKKANVQTGQICILARVVADHTSLCGHVLRLAACGTSVMWTGHVTSSTASTSSCVAICSLGRTTLCASGSDKGGWTSKLSSTGSQGHPLRKRGHLEHKELADQVLYTGMAVVRAAVGPPAPLGGPLGWQFQGNARPVWHCLIPGWWQQLMTGALAHWKPLVTLASIPEQVILAVQHRSGDASRQPRDSVVFTSHQLICKGQQHRDPLILSIRNRQRKVIARAMPEHCMHIIYRVGAR